MNKFVKTLVLAAVAVVGTATFTSVEAISSDEAVQSALARVPGATIANVTEFNRMKAKFITMVTNMTSKSMQILVLSLNGK